MASTILKRATGSFALKSTILADSLRIGGPYRSYAKIAVGADIVSAAPGVSLQKARSWDEGVSSNFSTTPLKDIFKVCELIRKLLNYYT
uniref:Mitochondrial peroxiredoxin family protein n=1 Tax=Rhizophora mucronata TaxID=61149 RepID=A0A2P2J674_RHIMU